MNVVRFLERFRFQAGSKRADRSIGDLKQRIGTVNGMSLYYFPTCPFCIRVLRAIEDLGIDGIELRDKRAEPRYEDELRAATGKTMVPCLRIEGEESEHWMHESADIVEYLREFSQES